MWLLLVGADGLAILKTMVRKWEIELGFKGFSLWVLSYTWKNYLGFNIVDLRKLSYFFYLITLDLTCLLYKKIKK